MELKACLFFQIQITTNFASKIELIFLKQIENVAEKLSKFVANKKNEGRVLRELCFFLCPSTFPCNCRVHNGEVDSFVVLLDQSRLKDNIFTKLSVMENIIN